MNDNLPIDVQIEAVLFFKGEPMKLKKIAELLGVSLEDVSSGLKILEDKLINRGVSLVYEGDSVLLGTSPKLSSLIEKVTKEEITRDLGRAGLETLAIILYKKKVTRREIDYIRGVNSSFILRNLMIRGLLERTESEKGERSYSYKPTLELVAFMGLNKIEDLPEYDAVLKEMEDFTKKEEMSDINTENDG